MPTKKENKQHAEPANQTSQQRSAVLVGQLLCALGRPAALYRVEVRHLWEEHYRANVFVGADAASTRVAHSFFLVTDAEGNILTSKPDITRQY